RLGRMERTIERASLPVRRMLTIARGTSPDLAPVDVASLCGAVRDLVGPALPTGMALHLDVADGLSTVLGAESDLEQVLVNLAANARDAVGEGGHVAIRARAATAEDGSPVVVLVVEDDGPGIPDDRKAEVFLPFVTSKS